MSKSLRSILAMLPKNDRQYLQVAFDNEIPNKWVEYEPGRFIGVNITDLSILVVEETAGYYAAGSIKHIGSDGD